MTASITCPRCRATSHNPNDVREGYCGKCRLFTVCLGCDEPITHGDLLAGGTDPEDATVNGQPWYLVYHRECQLRVFVGSVGHQMGLCSCHGGTMEDPEGMTKRQAAKAAERMARWKQHTLKVKGPGAPGPKT